MAINTAVPARQGITLALVQAETGLTGSVILSRNNHLSEAFHGRCAEALRRAANTATESGFDGYEISGTDDLGSLRLDAVGDILSEINRQLDVLRGKDGFHWGPSPRWSPEELAAIPAAQAQVSRLVGLRDAILKNLTLDPLA